MILEEPNADLHEIRVDTRGQERTTVYVLIRAHSEDAAHWRFKVQKGTLNDIDLDVEDVLQWELGDPT